MKIPKLTPQQISELDKYAAQKQLAEITVLLAGLDNELFIAVGELGEARIKVERLKNTKNTLVEIARALKSVITNG